MKRRQFIAVTALALLASVSGVSAQSWDREADAVVVGAGGAGLSAALTLAQGHAKVIVLEKNPFPGGTSNVAEGVGAAESRLQKYQGIFVSREQAFKTEMDSNNYVGNQALIHRWIYESGATLDWLQDQGVPFVDVEQLPKTGLTTWHIVKDRGKSLVKALSDKLKNDPNATVLYETPASALITDANKQVIGVEAKNDKGETIRIKAHSVILATGGFGDNPEMIKQYGGKVVAGALANFNKVGDGIKMAQTLGGAVSGMSALMYFPAADNRVPAAQKTGLGIADLGLQPFNVLVNEKGVRFTDEDVVFNFVRAGNVIAKENAVWSIFDDTIKQDLIHRGPDAGLGVLVHKMVPLPDIQQEWDKAKAAGNPYLQEADTAEELAGKIGVPAAALKATLDKYNHDAALNLDTAFAKDHRYLRPLTGKLFAVKVTDYHLVTLGGILTNDRLQALNEKGEVISPNLYMAGNDVGGLYGDTYTLDVSGSTYGFAVNSGRLTAFDILEQLGKK